MSEASEAKLALRNKERKALEDCLQMRGRDNLVLKWLLARDAFDLHGEGTQEEVDRLLSEVHHAYFAYLLFRP